MINFSKENKARLSELLLRALYQDKKVKGPLGTELTVYELLHIESENGLKKIYSVIKKQVEDKSNDEPWLQNENDKRKTEELKKSMELVSLIIGYKLSKRQNSEARKERDLIKAEIDRIKKENASPEEQLKELEEKLALASSNIEEVEE